METQLIVVYCICDDLVKVLNACEDKQSLMSNAEILTTMIAAAMFFGGNCEKARKFMLDGKYVKYMLSKSQFNRRIHAIDRHVIETIFYILSKVFVEQETNKEFCVDSFPVPVCDNIRISRCKIYTSEEHRGYISSKKRYFYGIRVHLVTSSTGAPIEILIAPGSYHDCRVFKAFNLDIPEGSVIYGDTAYTDYEYEDLLKDAAGISLVPGRKENSKRPLEPCLEFLRKLKRKIIETAFSEISALLPKSIHAVTAKGFCLKVFMFVLAYSFKCLQVTT